MVPGGGNDSPQRVLGSGQVTPIVEVARVKKLATVENKRSQQAEKTCDVRSRRVLRGGSGPEPPGGDAEERKTPVVVGEGATHETAQGSAYVGVGGAEAGRLRVRRCCAARVKNLGPPRAGAEQTESALCVLELTDCGQKSSGLSHSTAQEILRCQQPRKGA